MKISGSSQNWKQKSEFAKIEKSKKLKKKFDEKKIWWKKNFDEKKIWWKKNFDEKKILMKKKFDGKKILMKKKFWWFLENVKILIIPTKSKILV